MDRIHGSVGLLLEVIQDKMKSKGLGDTIAKFTEITGIKKIVKNTISECGCKKRQEWLNKKIPYKN